MNFPITSFAGRLNMMLCPCVKKKELPLLVIWHCYKAYWRTFILLLRIFRYGNDVPVTLILKEQKNAGMEKKEQKKRPIPHYRVYDASVKNRVFPWPKLLL